MRAEFKVEIESTFKFDMTYAGEKSILKIEASQAYKNVACWFEKEMLEQVKNVRVDEK